MGSLDVMASTISTSSTAATIPITLKSLERLGISRRSSQLTACIGTNFNNDGTALYMATAVLFMAQALGFDLSIPDQILIMLTTLVASVGAGGIPSGSFVTMPLFSPPCACRPRRSRSCSRSTGCSTAAGPHRTCSAT